MLSVFTECVLGSQIGKVIHQRFVREREMSIPIPCDPAPTPLGETRAPVCLDPTPHSNSSGLTDVDFTTYLWQQFTWISWFDSLLFWNINIATNYLGSSTARVCRLPGQKRKISLYSGQKRAFCPAISRSLLATLPLWSGRLANASDTGQRCRCQPSTTAQCCPGRRGKPRFPNHGCSHCVARQIEYKQ